jgi:hypothetical protein
MRSLRGSYKCCHLLGYRNGVHSASLSKTERLLGRNNRGSSVENRNYGRRGSAVLTTRHPFIRKKVGTNFVDSGGRPPLFFFFNEQLWQQFITNSSSRQPSSRVVTKSIFSGSLYRALNPICAVSTGWIVDSIKETSNAHVNTYRFEQEKQ